MQKDKLLESILFWKGEPISKHRLCELCSVNKNELEEIISILEQSLGDRGIVLIKTENELSLGTSPEASSIIENLTKEELSKELSKAALETLSIIIYMSPIRRSEVDYIRGVNSQFSIRHLEIRGLIERIQDAGDSRVYLYKPTINLLEYLGIKSINDIPDIETVKSRLSEIKDELRQENKSQDEEKS